MNKKKIQSFITSAAVAVTCFGSSLAGFTDKTGFLTKPITAEAVSYSDGISYGDYLTINKVDEDEDGTYDYIEIDNCDESVVSVEIPSEIDGLPVKIIGYMAFYWCTSLASITIPDSVTSIGDDAFHHCSSLASITIPDSVTSIGDDAFYWCKSLASIIIPDSVTSIGDDAFYECTNLESVTVGNGVTSIGGSAFSGCKSLASITIPDSVTSIGYWAFDGCSSLESITIPDSVTTIGYGAFDGCSSLESITIPDSVTSIGSWAFSGCTSLTSITIPESVTSIGSYAFRGCTSLASITIPDSVTSIGSDAFYNCKNLASITIENPDCEIYDSEYTISDTATIYGYENSNAQAYAEKYGYYFDLIGNEPEVTTPAVTTAVTTTSTTTATSVSEVTDVSDNDSELRYGDYLYYIKIDEDENGIFDYVKITDCSEYAVSVDIPAEIDGLPVTSIRSWAFDGCSNLSSITIPDSVTSIGEYAFLNCSSLASITISDSVTSIEYRAFFGCSSLTSITIPDSVTSIGDEAFFDCSSLTSITIPDSVTSIGDWAFYSCASLASITIPDSVTSIGGNAFSRCLSLTSITIKNPKCEIYDDASTIFNEYDGNYNAYFNGTIYGYENSTAQAYAEKYGYNFDLIGNEPEVTTPAVTTTVTTETDTTTTTTTTVITTRYIVKSHVPTGIAFGSWTKTQETVAVMVKEPIVYEYTDSGIEDAGFEILAEVTYEYEDTGGYADIFCEWSDGTTSYENLWVKDSGFRGEASIYSDYGYSDNSKAELAYYSSIQEVYESNVENYGEDLIIEVSVIGSYSVYDCSGNTVEENNVLFTIPIKILGPNSVEQTTTTTTTATEPVTTTTSVSETVESSETTSENTTAPPMTTAERTTTPKATGTDTVITTVLTTAITEVSSESFTTTTSVSTTITTTEGTTVITTTIKRNFQWNKDNWNFLNSSLSFVNGMHLDDKYLSKLRKNMSNTEWYTAMVWKNGKWHGSCYGMSSLALLSKCGLLPFDKYTDGADCLHDLQKPSQNSDVESLINYYQLLQAKDIIQQQYATVPYRSNEENIREIISQLASSQEVLIGYNKSGWGGHAVIAYDVTYRSWKINGVTYQGRIEILDPNASTAYSEDRCIYFNTTTYNWTIPAYASGNVNSVNGAVFNMILSDSDIVNYGGYLTGAAVEKMGNYVASLEIDEISDTYDITKVSRESDGAFSNQASDKDEILPASFYFVGGESEGKEGYYLKDSDSAYKVKQKTAQKMNMFINYESCIIGSEMASGKSMIFDPSGLAQIEGEATDYAINMIYNEGHYPTDWYRVNVNGANANNVCLEQVEDGYILSADNLENITVKTENDNVNANCSFSTKYKKVLIYEIDEKTIGISVDTDNDGTFETKVETGTADDTIIGDANEDGKVNVRDAAFIAQKIAKGKVNELPECADFNEDGKINVRDAAAIAKYLAGKTK